MNLVGQHAAAMKLGMPVTLTLGMALATVSACSGSSSRNHGAPAPQRGTGGTGAILGASGMGGLAGSDDDPADCRPRRCTATVCGVMQDDGCGTLVACACPNANDCVPATCASQGAECGSLDDGCGRTLDCGACEGEETCGGSGTANVCGCTPATCEQSGRQCGTLSDGCGGTLSCGDCATDCTCDDSGRCEAGDASTFTPRAFGHSAVSSGFAGSEAKYAELYDVPCFSADDCLDPCLARAGTQAMCEAATCTDATEDHCVPATVWSGLGALAAEGTDVASDCAELVVWSDSYPDFLRVTDFRLEVPASAQITGITATVRHAGGSAGTVVDTGVHLIKHGEMLSADRSNPTPWASPDLANVDYGGPNDLWNAAWSPADVNAADFGVALSAGFTRSSGNEQAYVDIVYVTVNYRVTCDATPTTR